MEAQTGGLALIWTGIVVLVLVLLHRLRRGAWGEAAFDSPPPSGRWPVVLVASGTLLALAGTALMVWGPA